jgi:hypothetical protein
MSSHKSQSRNQGFPLELVRTSLGCGYGNDPDNVSIKQGYIMVLGNKRMFKDIGKHIEVGGYEGKGLIETRGKYLDSLPQMGFPKLREVPENRLFCHADTSLYKYGTTINEFGKEKSYKNCMKTIGFPYRS